MTDSKFNKNDSDSLFDAYITMYTEQALGDVSEDCGGPHGKKDGKKLEEDKLPGKVGGPNTRKGKPTSDELEREADDEDGDAASEDQE